MSMGNDIIAGIVAFVFMISIYAIYLGILLAFLWAVWNWVIVPTLPYVAGLF
jgi:hypothetical protein